ncbi:MAG: hypothetical protein ACJ73S_23115 [Mycobacteriales bacterium]
MLVGFLVVAAGLAAVLGGLAWLAVRLRRRGAGAVMGPFEEMWHPAAVRYRQQIQVQERRMAPRPSADDRPPE